MTAIMPHFLSPLQIQLIGPDLWMTHAPLGYRSALLPTPIVVAAQFITDLASVPRRPLAYLLAGGRAPAPAVVHDWLYQHPAAHCDRDLADAILFEAMSVEQPSMGLPESAYVRWMMWAAVRAGGWVRWNQYRERGAAMNPVWTSTGWPESP